MTNDKLINSKKVKKLKSEKGNPLLFLPPERGRLREGTCQLVSFLTCQLKEM